MQHQKGVEVAQARVGQGLDAGEVAHLQGPASMDREHNY